MTTSPEPGAVANVNWNPDARVSRETLHALFESSPQGILAVDTEGVIRLWNKAAEAITGWREDEVVGRPIRAFSDKGWQMYEEYRARALLREVFHSLPMTAIRKDGATIHISFSTAPVLDAAGTVIGTVAIIYDITAKLALENALQESLAKMVRVVDETVHALATAIEKRDPYTAGHQARVAELACAIAGELDWFDADGIKGIWTAAVIHDIGKLYVPSEILSKPGELSELELALVRTHPQAGYEILREIEFPWPVADIVRQHHERQDGTGYPQGLRGDEILRQARVVAVADAVESISSFRPYRPAKGTEVALQHLKQARGTAYDAAVADACFALFGKGYARHFQAGEGA
ncbi:HD-GYP domain-containing protein [Geomesophilobacter sediminis]|uniref:PAS domain S-box protein n=1 Tax=Geomesophilobacter sediminis TaxID=2798584 RepID=A0A8J7LYU2_9BACT|nr:HD domain-containing phosphohydrolase [Geomesophilobacter sediminis]MBJ6725467.1 PAS domain S-box protein [Geomesophilobacter sediminis]